MNLLEADEYDTYPIKIDAPDTEALEATDELPVTFYYSPSTGAFAGVIYGLTTNFSLEATPRTGRLKVVYKKKSFDFARILVERHDGKAYPDHRVIFNDGDPQNLRRTNLSLIKKTNRDIYKYVGS